MRVLHLLKTSTGASWALREVRELVKLGLDVHVAMPGGGGLASEYEKAGVTIHRFPCDLPIHRPWCWKELFASFRAVVGAVKPEIIHSHFVGTTVLMRMALGRDHPIPRVFQVPGPLHLEHWFFRTAEIALAGPRDHWIGSCRWTCKRYEKSGVPRSRVHLAFYGSDLDEINTAAHGRLRGEIGVDSGVRIIGMVAFMYAPKLYLGQSRGIKGHEDLIDAFDIVQRAEPKTICVMVGGAWDGADAYERKVREYARRKCGDAVLFLGTRNDVHYLYPDFDVVVHPSLSENLGGAAESLLHGIPTIATNVGGLPDLVADGKTGWLVPPHDPQRLADAIQEALSDPEEARQRAERGQTLAQNLLDVGQTARQVYDIYHKILAET